MSTILTAECRAICICWHTKDKDKSEAMSAFEKILLSCHKPLLIYIVDNHENGKEEIRSTFER